MKKVFTLIEVLIATLIISVLVVVIFQIYRKVMDIGIRIQNEKTINGEFLFVSQNIQNFADKYNIDYDRYDPSYLRQRNGFTDILYLTGEGQFVSVYFTGDCVDDISQIASKQCWIEVNKAGEIVELSDKNKVYFTKHYFKILPYEDVSKYNLAFEDTYQNGFWLFAQSYIKRYSDRNWSYKVNLDYQNFFNIRKYNF